jgi:hypothetical protein
MEKLSRRAAIEESAGTGCGIEGAVMLTKTQIRKLLAQDEKLCLDPLQVLSIMRSAKAHPIKTKEIPNDDEGNREMPLSIYSLMLHLRDIHDIHPPPPTPSLSYTHSSFERICRLSPLCAVCSLNH